MQGARCTLSVDPIEIVKAKNSWYREIPATNSDFIGQRRQTYYTVRPWSLWHLVFSKLYARRRKVDDVTIGDLAISEDATAKRLRWRRPPTPGDLSVSFSRWWYSLSLFFLFSLSLFLFFFRNILIVPLYRNVADILGNHAIESDFWILANRHWCSYIKISSTYFMQEQTCINKSCNIEATLFFRHSGRILENKITRKYHIKYIYNNYIYYI